MRILPASPADAAALTAIAFAAKRHWGYPEAWVRQWAAQLTITGEMIANHPTYQARNADSIVGFYLLRLEAGEARLDHLWVLPQAMGSGVGRALFSHAENTAKAANARALTIESDPNAEGFYLRMGATTFGYNPATIDDQIRSLPLMTKRLD